MIVYNIAGKKYKFIRYLNSVIHNLITAFNRIECINLYNNLINLVKYSDTRAVYPERIELITCNYLLD